MGVPDAFVISGFDGVAISYRVDMLSASRRVLRYNTRGHGPSDPGQVPYDIDQLTGDALSLFDGGT